jgi:hypothetical protein
MHPHARRPVARLADVNFIIHTPATFISPLFSTKPRSLLKITHSPHAIFKPEQNP